VKAQGILAALLALLVGLLYYGPEHLAAATGWRQPGVDYIAAGVEAFLLWTAAAWLLSGRYAAAPCVWAASEAAMRTGCRAALPLDVPLSIPIGQNMCEVAIGFKMNWVSYLTASVAIAITAQSLRHVATRDAWHQNI
jgi:hypothetical protein